MNKPTSTQLKDFANKYSWHKQMSESKGLDSYDNYGGTNLGDLVTVVGRNRDSEILDDSNFNSALEMLGGESETVTVERFGHWGCGWFELILVDAKDIKALTTAYEIKQCLEHYPVLDDSDYYERESEYHSDFAEGSKDNLAAALTEHLGLPEDLATSNEMLLIAFMLNMECQRYYGNDCCINIYAGRDPDSSDIERLAECTKQLISNDGDSSAVLKFLAAALNIEAA